VVQDRCSHSKELLVPLKFDWQAIVRGDELPSCAVLHPDIGEAVVIVIGLSVDSPRS
jgi:hypothetical protein